MSSVNEERYLRAARANGCPRDQIARFKVGGYVAQPKQLEFHSVCRQADREDGPNEIGFGGARGGAKTHGIISQLMLDDCQRRDNLKALLLRRVGKAVRESFEDLRRKILSNTPHEYLRSSGVIKFPNGSRVILGHFKDARDIDAYLGLEYDLIVVEEATTLVEDRYKSIRTCCRTARNDWKARTYSSTNPGGVGHAWYKSRFIVPALSDQETSTRFVFATVEDNKYLDQDYRDTLEELTGWKKKAWRYGDWDIAAGQFFTTFSSTAHVMSPIELPEYYYTWLAMDYGYGLTHWNIAYLLSQDDHGNIYIRDELAHRKTLVPTIAKDLIDLLDRNKVKIPTREIDFVLGSDAFTERGTSGESIAVQWRQAKFSPQLAYMNRIDGASEVLRLLGDPDEGIKSHLRIFSTCTKLIDCLPSMEHDPRRPVDVLKQATSESGIGGDDPYDALRYGIMHVWAGNRPTIAESPLIDWRG